MTQDIWEDLLLAYLHDPPDKAADILNHVARACQYAEAVLDRNVDPGELKLRADVQASVVERFPAPHWKHLSVSPVGDRLLIRHPLSGSSRELVNCRTDQPWATDVIRGIIQGLGDDRERRFLAVWRLLPERLPEHGHDWLAQPPADTRTPDHTIWNHLDIAAGLRAAEEGGSGVALLSFALGPVQSFIAAARSVRDLWAGSMILSYLTFRALLPIVESQGPSALIYPSLRGIPLLDLWLHKQKGVSVPDLDVELRRAPCLPNRFLAVVPCGADGGTAKDLAERCKRAARTAWEKLAETVRSRLRDQLSNFPDWDRRWSQQIGDFFDFRTAILPMAGSRERVEGSLANLLDNKASFREAFPGADSVRQLARAINQAGHQPGYDQEHAGRWQYQIELSARIMQSQRSIRAVPTYQATSPCPPKCSLLGTYEQMGPDGLDDSRRFWDDFVQKVTVKGVRLRKAERFCAVALVKRFAAPAALASKLDLEMSHLHFEDTSSVAAAGWLLDYKDLEEYAKSRRSSSWLHWIRPDQEKEDGEEEIPPPIWRSLQAARARQRPPTYYAILMLDGDEMGRWLRGEKSPEARQVMHPDLVSYFERLGEGTKAGLEARRPVGPALHAAISEALANFALHFVPRIIARHHGTLIYAGGDDVLALLPTATALECAGELRNTFRQDWQRDHTGRERLLMGRAATVSAGLAIVHVKEDLRFALQAARNAEQEAKRAGRDTLQIKVCRRSGEHSSALCPWEEVSQVLDWVKAFRDGASDRWAYHLAAELATLQALVPAAMLAEIRRQVDRSEQQTRKLLQGTETRSAAELVSAAFERYRQAQATVLDPPRRRFADDATALTQFVTLCQSASFLARGRDR